MSNTGFSLMQSLGFMSFKFKDLTTHSATLLHSEALSQLNYSDKALSQSMSSSFGASFATLKVRNQKLGLVMLFLLLETLTSIPNSSSMGILHVQWPLDAFSLHWCFKLINHLCNVPLVLVVGKHPSFAVVNSSSFLCWLCQCLSVTRVSAGLPLMMS